jgi:4-carboxymuconolactone decarboxylase
MSADDSERRKRGLKMFEEVYGGVVPVPPPEYRGAFFFQTIDQLFAETWTRSELPIRDKRLVALGCVAALGETEMFEIQLRAAMAKGELTDAQVEEMILFLPAYVSYPRTSKLLAISQKILAERKAADPKDAGKDAGKGNGKEKGKGKRKAKA